MNLQDGIPPFPTSHQEPAPRPRRGRWLLVSVVLPLVLLAAFVALAVLTAHGALWAVNPVGDEWECTQGEAPAYVTGESSGTGGCYDEDAILPAGVQWDPLGNRPMSYNCDKSGWVLVEHQQVSSGVTSVVQDCVREDAVLPDTWRVVTGQGSG